jgi:hypothetical protein
MTKQEAQALDTALALLYGNLALINGSRERLIAKAHRLVGDKRDSWRRNAWGLSHAEVIEKVNDMAAGADRTDLSVGAQPSKLLADLAALDADAGAKRDEIEAMDAIYRADPWARYILCLSSDGHIHSAVGCSTLRYDTPVEWHPELSGLTVAEAVAKLGPTLCSVCFPAAPVKWRRKRTDVDREANAAERAARAKAKFVKNLRPEEQFRVDGERITSVSACKNILRREVEHRNMFGRGPTRAHPLYVEGAKRAAGVLLARDADHGGMTEAEICTLIARAEKRAQKENGR